MIMKCLNIGALGGVTVFWANIEFFEFPPKNAVTLPNLHMQIYDPLLIMDPGTCDPAPNLGAQWHYVSE
jgi:hypothetical protein